MDGRTMKLKDVKPGDLVKVTNGPFGWAKVIRHRATKYSQVLEVLRPWMAADHPDGSANGYPYIGMEVFDLFMDSDADYEVVQANRERLR